MAFRETELFQEVALDAREAVIVRRPLSRVDAVVGESSGAHRKFSSEAASAATVGVNTQHSTFNTQHSANVTAPNPPSIATMQLPEEGIDAFSKCALAYLRFAAASAKCLRRSMQLHICALQVHKRRCMIRSFICVHRPMTGTHLIHHVEEIN